MRTLTGFGRGMECIGKIGFDSYAEAEHQIGKLIRKGAHRPEHGVLHPYLCRFCLKHHLGHMRERR